MDCGPTCLKMISKFFGRSYSLQYLREISEINRDGVSLLGISQAAEKIGFRTSGIRIKHSNIKNIELPCILYWRQNHFIVLYRISSNFLSKKSTYHIADPAKGLINYTEQQFVKNWTNNSTDLNFEGIALLITPSPEFYNAEKESPSSPQSLNFLSKYLLKYKKLVFQLFLGLGFGSLLQLILPFLTQALVDVGINTKNISFVYIILLAQTMLFLGRLSVEFIRSWILIHISSRINISILTDFLIKLMKLPMSFFEAKKTGDIMQRMSDQGRIQSFLTGSSLNTVFSLFNLLVFAFVLAYYNTMIFTIFMVSSILYSLWVLAFLKKRRELDFRRFDLSSENQNTMVQMIAGMQEIKLNNCEQEMRWEWERVQAKLFNFGLKTLRLGQFQQTGAFFINEGKNILITFIVAKSVIDGQLTLGGMMAIQYVVGQLSSPIEQLLSFLQQWQDAKISLERMNEVHNMENEQDSESIPINELPLNKEISFNNLTFKYPGAGNEPVLNGINLIIEAGKTTAIVGTSGSGKTTILKLLLRFYKFRNQEIKIGNSYLNQIGFAFWRSRCGVVMQDGFIFSDTIKRNIAVNDEFPDNEKLNNAISIANIRDFIESLPLGVNTKIGASGNGISQGQKQRILIARAVYKDPEFIFFDEATNALDSNNEKVIMENLNDFFKGKTVVIAAHRLSTVKNADKIIVIDKGRVVEQGTHETLRKNKGDYYNLVENQIQLGK